MRTRWLGLSTVLSAALPVFLVCSVAADDDVPKQAWKDLACYPSRGLTPLYPETGRACREILSGNERWAVLPRPIDTVHARPDQPPCFEMHDGDSYYNDYFGNAEAIRWAAEQTWDGQFRLLYNTKLRARHDNELWLEIDGFRPELKSLVGGEWTTYRPLGGERFSFRTPCRLAQAGKTRWWLASQSGLFLLEHGTLRRAKIPGWPGGAAEGVVSARRRAVAWSSASPTGQATIAFLDRKQWTTREIRHRTWTGAALRADGSVVLADQSQVIVVRPPAAGEDESESESDEEQVGPKRQEELEHIKAGHVPWDEDWLRPTGAPAVSPFGSALLSATRLSDGTYGLLRDLSDGRREWIEWADARGAQFTAAPEDGFLVFSTGKLFLLSSTSRELAPLTDDGEIRSGDRLLGCDRSGRVYFQRGTAILTFLPGPAESPSAEPRGRPSFDRDPFPQVAPHLLSLVARDAPPDRRHADLRAAVDAKGTVWFVRPDGVVMKMPCGQEEPQLADDRLGDGCLLWPGVDDSMLIMRKEGRVALAHGDRHLTLADSLPELVEAAWDALLAGAPRSSCDPRMDLRPRSAAGRCASPWLAIGKSLYWSDGKQVLRIRALDKEAAEDGRVGMDVICEGRFDMLGPLGNGDLLLAKTGSRVTDWYLVENPDGTSKLQSVASPPRQQSGGTLSSPASCAGPWLLDADGGLWLLQGFDRTYRIDSIAKWPMLKDFGPPRFEHPPGIVWAYHSSRVFEGYEIAGGNGFRRSCRPTYLEHLTPFAPLKDTVLCLTPQGLARLRFDKDDPEIDAVVQSMPVRWNGTPVRYIGMSGGHVLLLVAEDSTNRLVRVRLELPTKSQPADSPPNP